MIELEKLYENAERNLNHPQQDWQKFVVNFKNIFDSTMVLFRLRRGNQGDLYSPLGELFAGTNPALLQGQSLKTIPKKFRGNDADKQELAPVRPNARTLQVDALPKFKVPPKI